MNAIEALRLADPAGSTEEKGLGPEDERLLRQILAMPTDARPAAAPTRPRRDRRPVLVTAMVAVVIAAVAMIAIRFGAQAPHVASTAGPSVPTVTTELRQALTSVLPEAFDGRAAITWTDASPGGDGEMVDLSDKVPVYAAACEGGGTVRISVSGLADRILDCGRLTTLGPVDLGGGVADKGVSFSVSAASGHPRYLVKLTGVAASAATSGTGSATDGTTTRGLMVVTPTSTP